MTLGNVGKASSSDFAGKRKVLLVPYVVATREDQELRDLVGTYWAEAAAQVRKLSAVFGPVRHVFHEGSVGQGEQALDALEKSSPLAFSIVKEAVESGAMLEPTEDPRALGETLDLHRCMAVVQSSHTLMHRLVDWFEECRKRRYLAIAENIEKYVRPDEVAVLVISPDHEVQFPRDVEVVYIVPPVLDSINRWMRDHRIEPASTDAATQTET